MKILTRYLLRSHAGPFLFAFFALTGLVLVNTLARQLAELAGKGLPARVFFEFFLLSLPANIALTVPMSVLVAVLYTFSELAAENEITALKASGVDVRRLALPLLTIAVLITGGMVWFNDRVLTAANYRWQMLMTDLARTSPLLLFREQVVNPIPTVDGSTRYHLQAHAIDPATNRLFDVTIFDVSDPEVARTIYADSARMALTESRTDLILTLFDGQTRETQLDQPEAFQSVAFRRQMLRIDGVGQQLERSTQSSFRTDRDMTIAMMRDTVGSLRERLHAVPGGSRESRGPVATPATGERVAEVRILRRQIREYELEIQKKYSIATATLVFVLVGIPLALRFPRGGSGLVIGASILIFAVFYIGLRLGEVLANEGYVPPVVAMWLTNVVFGAVGIVAFLRAGGDHGSSRGGGWGDMPRWPRLRRRRRVEPRSSQAPA